MTYWWNVLGRIDDLDRSVAQLQASINEMENDEMATQAQVDALTTAVSKVAADLATAKTDLQTEINSLAAANPALDLTALSAAIAPLDASVVALETLAPTA